MDTIAASKYILKRGSTKFFYSDQNMKEHKFIFSKSEYH